MIFERLLPTELLKQHVALMTNRSGPRSQARPDVPAIALLFGLPVLAAVFACRSGVELAQPAALLAALSLMSAGLLAAFGQIAGIRSKYRLPDDGFDPEWRVRAMLDEAVAHILTAALTAVALAVVIVAGMNAGAPTPAAGAAQLLAHWASVAVIGGGTYLALLFLMVVRKLWGAYEVANERDQEQDYLRRG